MAPVITDRRHMQSAYGRNQCKSAKMLDPQETLFCLFQIG